MMYFLLENGWIFQPAGCDRLREGRQTPDDPVVHSTGFSGRFDVGFFFFRLFPVPLESFKDHWTFFCRILRQKKKETSLMYHIIL